MPYKNLGLEPPLVEFLEKLEANSVDISTLPIEELRQASLDLFHLPESQRVKVGPTWDREVQGVPVRIYCPVGDGPFPVLVYFHAGGWVVGDIERADPFCRRLVDRTGCAVVSVDYRRAPEEIHPAALDDCYIATCWVAQHAGEIACDPTRIGVAGGSCGGTLATGVALRARDEEGPSLSCQLLMYPCVSFEMERADYDQCLDKDFLPFEKMRWYWDQYLPHGPDRYASPLDEEDLTRLPPAVVILGEHDPLTAEGKRYVKRLQAAGNRVYEQLYAGMIHSFLEMPFPLVGADLAFENIGLAVRKLMNA